MNMHVRSSSDELLPAARVRQRYSVSDMSLWRWPRDPDLGFPQPIYINGRRYWREADLVAFEIRQAAKPKAA